MKRVLSTMLLWAAWLVWLPFQVFGIQRLLASSMASEVKIAIIVFEAIFSILYIVSTLINAHRVQKVSVEEYPRLVPYTIVFALVLVGLAIIIGTVAGRHHVELLGPFIYSAAYIAGALPLPWAIPVNIAIVAVCVAIGLLVPVPEFGQTVFLITVVSFVVTTLIRSVTTGTALRGARAEIERLAVEAERSRIARDIHDLIGQGLSLIALKSQLAQRLITDKPDQAAHELSEIEHASRSLLQDVREALSGVKHPTVSGELHTARQLLEAAGISLNEHVDTTGLAHISREHAETIAWTVREGVTNVVKHSGAATCTIRIETLPSHIHADISDDGTAGLADKDSGNGIRGLRERVKALGGQCDAGKTAHGGFGLSVKLPLRPGERGL